MLAFADLISAALGLAAAIILAYPAIRMISAKRHWESVRELQRLQKGNPLLTTDLAELKQRVEERQLGRAHEALICNLVGLTLLAASFVFLFLAAVERRSEAAKDASHNEVVPIQELR